MFRLKKLFFLIFILAIQATKASIILKPMDTLSLTSFELKSPQEIFGYDPQFKQTEKQFNDTKKKRFLLFAHGSPGPEDPQEWCRQEFPENKYYSSGCPIFRDKVTTKWKYKNWGQEQDAEVLLYKIIDNCNSGIVTDLFGHSRGAGAIITLLDIIYSPKKYKKIWKKFGVTKKIYKKNSSSKHSSINIIDFEKIIKIRKSIGKVFLEKPLMDSNDFIKMIIPQSFNWIVKVGVALFTGHSFNIKKQPITILKDIVEKEENIDIHITLAAHDDIVGNKNDDVLKQLSDKAGWTIIKTLETHNVIKLTKKFYNNYCKTGNLKVTEKNPTYEDVEAYSKIFTKRNICYVNAEKLYKRIYRFNGNLI